MEESNIYQKSMNDDMIIQLIGAFVKTIRIEQNYTQQVLAEKSGINRTTLSDLESGKRCQLITLIQVLRILDRLDVFNAFKIEQKISPMLLAEMEMKKRYRVRGKKNNASDNDNKSDW